jgi:hypothetical protein
MQKACAGFRNKGGTMPKHFIRGFNGKGKTLEEIYIVDEGLGGHYLSIMFRDNTELSFDLTTVITLRPTLWDWKKDKSKSKSNPRVKEYRKSNLANKVYRGRSGLKMEINVFELGENQKPRSAERGTTSENLAVHDAHCRSPVLRFGVPPYVLLPVRSKLLGLNDCPQH